MAEGTTPAGNDFAGQVISQVTRSWKTLDLSLTGALAQIYGEAQRSLHEWNSTSISQHQVGISLTCIGRQGDRVVIAARGPATALHLTDGSVTRYEPDDEHAALMYGAGQAPPQLTRLHFGAGDRVLLVTTNVISDLDDELLDGILALPLADVLPDLYRRVAHLRDATALLLVAPGADEEIGAEPAAPAADEPLIGAAQPATVGSGRAPAAPPEELNFQPSLFIDGGAVGTSLERARQRLLAIDARPRIAGAVPAATAPEVRPLRRVAGDDVFAAPTPPTTPWTPTAAETRTGAAQRWHQPRAEAEPPRTPRISAAPAPGAARTGSFTRELARSRPSTAPTPSAPADAPLVSELAAGRRAQVTGLSRSAYAEGIVTEAGKPSPTDSLVRMRDDIGGGRRRGGGARSRRGTDSSLPPTWFIVVIGLGLLLGLAGWVVLPRVLNSDTDTRLAELIDEAEREIATANAVVDPGAQRDSLTRARGILLEAGALEGGAELSEPRLNEVAGAIADLDAIVAPLAIEVIADLSEFGDTPVAAERLAIGATHAYLLDVASERVLATDLATGETTTILPAAEGTAITPTVIAYAEAVELGGSTLLIADSSQALWAYRARSGLSPLGFAAPDGLTITDLAFLDGQLYVLDAPQAVIFRFAAEPGGFRSEPVIALATPALSTAQRLMVDGEIFTADGDGTVRRFSGELALELSQAGIDEPLQAAETPRALEFANEIAVLDAAADRIIVLGRDGTFLRQYRHDDLANLTAFATRGEFGYVFSGEQLRRITF